MDAEEYKDCSAAQAALLSVVTPQLRAVTAFVDSEKNVFYMSFFHDGIIDGKIQDLWECAITEASACLEPDPFIKPQIMRVDYPEPFPLFGRLAYLRHETINRMGALLTMNQALLGKISANLRAVKIDFDEANVHLMFYYHNEVLQMNYELSKSIHREFVQRFPNYYIHLNTVRWDYPQVIPLEGELVYLRKE